MAETRTITNKPEYSIGYVITEQDAKLAGLEGGAWRVVEITGEQVIIEQLPSNTLGTGNE